VSVPKAADEEDTEQENVQGKGTLKVMSIAFLLEDKDSAVIWRGPKKSAIIKQFLEDVMWGPLDVLIIDTPPGTSDEHLSVCETLLSKYHPDGAIIVTTPQGVSLADVRKEISFCHTIRLPILGIVENMSGFVCPHCAECTNIFSRGGGEALAQELQLPFLGRIPIDPNIGLACDEGKSFVAQHADSKSLTALSAFVDSFYSGGK
jgi:Mrp family chromosome partitioning ATPase